MLHATATAEKPAQAVVAERAYVETAVRSQEELDADYPKEAAKDRRDQRRALEVSGQTAGVRDAVLAALVAYDAAEALYAVYRPLDAVYAKDRNDRPALERRRDRAEARWQKARAAALNAAEKVLDVPTAPGAETAAKFQAFLLLTYVPNTNARHRKPFTIERAVEAMFEEDAQRVLVQALKAISTAPTPPTASIDRSAWDAAMADYRRKLQAYDAADAARDAHKAEIYSRAFGDQIEVFTKECVTISPSRKARILRWHTVEDLQNDRSKHPSIKLALQPILQDALPVIEEALQDDRADFHLDDLCDDMQDALAVLDRLPAPDLEALAFKVREQLAIAHDMQSWQLDTLEGMTEKLSTDYPCVRLEFTWYQDILRLLGSDSPAVHAKAWDPKPWIERFRAAGGKLSLYEYGRNLGDRLGVRVSFDIGPDADDAACCALMNEVNDWRREPIAEAVQDELREKREAARQAAKAWLDEYRALGGEAGHLVTKEGAFFSLTHPRPATERSRELERMINADKALEDAVVALLPAHVAPDALTKSRLDHVKGPSGRPVPVVGYVGDNDEVHFYDGAGAHLGRGGQADVSTDPLPAA